MAFKYCIFTFIFIKINFRQQKDDGFLICFQDDLFVLIQYFYQTDALDYRLLAPFTFGIWLVYFKNFIKFSENWFCHRFLSLMTGFVFSWLSRGNYLENRKLMKEFWLKKILWTVKFTITDQLKTKISAVLKFLKSSAR